MKVLVYVYSKRYLSGRPGLSSMDEDEVPTFSIESKQKP